MLSIFEHVNLNMLLLIGSTIVATVMAIVMIFVRLKAAEQPATIKRIIIPPIMMSTGAFMFLIPQFHVPWTQVIEAVFLGVICSVFLIKTSKFEIRNDNIFLIPSKAFSFILFGLLAIRIIFKLIIGSTISFGETSGMFYLLAFGMIVTWRVAMLYQFIQLRQKLRRRRSVTQ